ncbi:MAG: response regulator [Ardenticatenaceae bacterium]|nr:response regulator [Ardenticatenaceae bacterium]MCB9443182.1 response regulator [Ardenticatenaceae bacterium]
MHVHEEIQILIAEDDYLVGEMIQGMLSELGYAVVGLAMSGVQALELTAELKPDVVIMDIQMPGMDGVAAAQKIQECCQTPVVILSAYETPELVQKASKAGVNAYLLKPPDSRELERAITLAMARFEDMVALRRLNDDLQASNAELDAFAHTVAHDLQSPLGLISGFGEMLLLNYDEYPPEQHKNILSKITRTAQKMSNIVSELLVLSSVRQMDVEFETLDMVQILDEAQQRLAEEIKSSHAEIILPLSWPQARGYAPWIEEVWFNYLSNGIKYGGTPPRLELGVTEQPEGVLCFWVRDNGCGLTAVDQTELFTPFTKLSQVRAKGHGLGLSIVRRIMERLGGTVGVNSDIGKGSTFWFTLSSVLTNEIG